MKFQVSLLICSLFLLSCNCKNEGSIHKNDLNLPEKYLNLVDDKTIYDFINSESFNQNPVYAISEILICNPHRFELGGDCVILSLLDSLLTDKDRDFISKQYKNSINFNWNQKLIKRKKVFKIDPKAYSSVKEQQKYWQLMIEKYDGFCEVNQPLFNIKKDIAIVRVTFHCGALCSQGGTYVYKLTSNGNWVLFKTIEDWVS